MLLGLCVLAGAATVLSACNTNAGAAQDFGSTRYVMTTTPENSSL
jgi:predicted small secreted protein